MMVVSGPTNPDNQLTYHIIKVISEQKVRFSELDDENNESEDDENKSSSVEAATTQKSVEKIYQGCGKIKSCFGIPTGCTDSCSTFTAAMKVGEDFFLNL